MTEYWRDEKLEALGREVLDMYHEDKMGLATFLFVFRDPPATCGTTTVLGKASKIPERWCNISNLTEDFLIEIASVPWKEMSKDERIALLDHELCHCTVETHPKTGKVKLSMQPHDLEEFLEIYRRHGEWRPALQSIATMVRKRPVEKD